MDSDGRFETENLNQWRLENHWRGLKRRNHSRRFAAASGNDGDGETTMAMMRILNTWF
jgi:hypothetical protein